MDSLRNLDIIGKSIQFRFKSSERYQSVFGGFLTILLIVLICVFSEPLVVGIFTFDSPKIVKSVNYKNVAFLNLTDNFPLMMTVVQRGLIFLDNPDSYYTISAIAYHGNYTYNGTHKTPTVNLTTMDLHKCSNDTIYKDFGEHTSLFLDAYPNSDLTTAYCFPMGQSLSYIYGFLGQRPLHYIDFSVNFCDNSTSKVTCKSVDEIKKALSQGIMLVSYPDYYLDHEKLEPGKFFLNTKSFPVSASFYKR